MWRSMGATLVAGFLTACSDGSTIQVSYSAQDPYSDPALLTVELAWPGGGQHLEGRTFTTTQGGAPHSPVIDVPTRGELRVQTQLVTQDGDTLARTGGTLTLQPDYGYGAGAVVGLLSPDGFCSNVVDRAPVLTPGGGVTPDTLFLVLTGIHEEAIC